MTSFAYATLLIGESYLPGVLTLTSSISQESKQLIDEIYDEIIPINDKLITSPLEKLSEQLNRSELSITYSKILLWNQINYDSIVYLDADVLPLSNLDDIFTQFDINHDEIAASPDSGWPDIFNSGVLKIKPSEETFKKLLEYSSNPENSFDGADQGLLNEYFPNWVRLPYLYNVTPNYRHDYQYLPAFNRFFNDIKVLHYIGQVKPWHYENILASDLANFHQFWWDDFNKFFGNDAKLKYRLLNLPRGEANTLKFSKTENVWDDPSTVGGGSDAGFESEEKDHPPLFPWEHREDKRQPLRVFRDISTSSSEEDRIHSDPIDKEVAETIRIIRDTKIGKDVKSPLLSENYGYEKAADAKFNPDKSLAEVSKLPVKFFSREKAKKEDK
ncbi:hypothetical protein G210_3764 [Candida maltosa Xu316]|uniref:Glycogenin glucosyltransferase n=1 Tax=Candida maltosa (strain Xu316) TaxID=1245528 RepID=M3JUG6_CANMX|nr:hypothetical protein G210_3764 [Candida maltosa Xu316]